MSTIQTETTPTFSVSELNRRARQLLELHLNQVWVEGEISNLATPASGHWYFTLKDEDAQVSCAMFRNRNSHVSFRPKAGMHIKLRAKVSIYENRGNYQLIVDSMEEAGTGALQRAFEELKKKLDKEGLFGPEFKQDLPEYPKRIGVITSPTGAAIHDILNVLERRYPLLEVVVFPVAVQGEAAIGEICSAIELANRIDDIDALIVGRGGGSLEDLQAFNSEAVARSLFSCEIPVISAVGHEVDFSIADFVADVRAPTPSAAAELISPDSEELMQTLGSFEQYFIAFITQQLSSQTKHVGYLKQLLKHPGQKLNEQAQHLDHLEQRLTNATQIQIHTHKNRTQELVFKILSSNPKQNIKVHQMVLANSLDQLKNHMLNKFKDKSNQFQNLTQLLNSVSPLSTLNRGYAIVSNQQGVTVESVEQLNEGDKIKTRLKDGEMDCSVEKIIKN